MPTHEEGKGMQQQGAGTTWLRRVIEGDWVGCDQFGIVYLHAAARHTKPLS